MEKPERIDGKRPRYLNRASHPVCFWKARGKIYEKEVIKLLNGDNECARYDGTLALRKDDRFPSLISDWQKAQEFFDKLKHESRQVAKLGTKPRHTWDKVALLWLKEKETTRVLNLTYRCLDTLLPSRAANIGTTQQVRALSGSAKRKKPNRQQTAQIVIWRLCDPSSTVLSAYGDGSIRPWQLLFTKNPKKRVLYLLPKKVNALMKELPEHQRPVIAFSLLTGLRKSNILNLRWNQVDLLKGIVSISGREMKNGNDHVIQLSDAAFKVVTAQLGKNTEHVFTYKGRKVNEINTIAFRNALKRAGIKDYRFHDNRHTWTSTLIQNGVSLYELQEMDAWSSTEMVKRYAHLAPQNMKQKR